MATAAPPPPVPPASAPAPASEPSPVRGLARAAGTVMAATLLSRVLGLVRDIVIAHQLGTRVGADAYVAAFKVPDLLMYLVAGGALSSTFIPVFREYLHGGKERQAWKTFSVVATVTVVLSTLFVVVAEVWTPAFVRLLNPGYDAATLALAVPLTRIVLPAQIFFMLGGLLMGTLNARGSFLIPALGPSVYNLGIIVGAIFLYPVLGLPGLMWGALGGAIVGNFALQVRAVSRAGMRFRPSLAVAHPGAVKVWRLMLPILLGVSLPNVDQIITSRFASELPVGSQAALQYAVRLMLIPIGVFAQAMGIAVLPALSAHAAAGSKKEFRATASKALRTIWFLTVPASALLFVLAGPLVTLLLRSGAFNQHSADITAEALRWYALGIWAWSAQAILTRGFYALQDSRTPVISGTVMTVIFIAMSWAVVNMTDAGVGGLALATTVAATMHMGVMLVLLRRRAGGLRDGLLLVSAVKTTLATAALCAAAVLLRGVCGHVLPPTLLPKLASAVTLTVAGGGGLVSYLVVARLLRMTELTNVLDMARRRKAA